MPYLLDTCALSEIITRKPDRAVLTRIRTLPAAQTFISSVTLGEIRQGIDLMKDSKRKIELQNWLYSQLLPQYTHRTIPFGTDEALRWGQLQAEMWAGGSKMEIEDSLIAATALVHGLTVVTRNESDFEPSGVRIFNPWKP
jgi:predicted nucleic acid-binding protein